MTAIHDLLNLCEATAEKDNKAISACNTMQLFILWVSWALIGCATRRIPVFFGGDSWGIRERDTRGAVFVIFRSPSPSSPVAVSVAISGRGLWYLFDCCLEVQAQIRYSSGNSCVRISCPVLCYCYVDPGWLVIYFFLAPNLNWRFYFLLF